MAKIKAIFAKIKAFVSGFFSKKSTGETTKRDINYKNIIILVSVFLVGFVITVLFLPTRETVNFREVSKDADKPSDTETAKKPMNQGDPSKLWGSPSQYGTKGQASQVNYNTPMLIAPHGGNSHLEVHAGTHLRIEIVDKFVASMEPVPVMGRVMEDATTESGLSIPEGSLLYGEASFQKQSERALIQFRRISYPSGEVRSISAGVVSPDGMPGLQGEVHSDSLKNSTGQFITTFVGAMAAGSLERDFMGNSKGGITNGLLQGVSETAKARAQKYGESLKEERSWIEVSGGQECEAILNQSFNMIESEVNP